MLDWLFGTAPKEKTIPVVKQSETALTVPSGVIKIRSKTEVDAIRYRAGHADEILLAVGQTIGGRLLPSGVIEFTGSYNSSLNNKSIAPGQWLVKASLTSGGIAGDHGYSVWDEKTVRGRFDVPEASDDGES